ncbi:MAG: sigma-70 family RNA polymerase sigma factor [Phycisphaeraceae bacterium]|nr:sigma-70 family RNA polymerase sigma factor [Phycisphaeraceae bacterium]
MARIGLRHATLTAADDNSDLDPSILQRIAAGDRSAVQECIGQYAGLVWSLARRMCLNGADAEDAVQEIFIEIWRNAFRFDPGVASETAFVAMIARRRLIDRRRRISRQRDRAPLDEAPAVNEQPKPELGEEAGIAAKALEELSTEQQRVLRLSLLQGLSHEKIATATGLPLGTVKTHARRGLLRIREMLSTKRGEGVKS